MRQNYLIPIILFTFSSIFSQNNKSYSVNGYVQDKESGEKLIGCYVFDSANKKGAFTNVFGYFSISQGEGDCNILARYLGYIAQSITGTRCSLHPRPDRTARPPSHRSAPSSTDNPRPSGSDPTSRAHCPRLFLGDSDW